MSKAFTREDDLPEPKVTRRPQSLLPPGAKNYLTPDGASRLRAELQKLTEVERPRIVAISNQNPAPELDSLDHRIQQLNYTLETAVVVPPATGAEPRVKFGAIVTVREPGGDESQYRIVGVDETDPDRGWVSWLSPLARALLNAGIGDRVRLKLPSGEKELDIVDIHYP